MSGAVVAVTQWLVRATDDRVVTASNLVRLPHIACVFRRHNKPSLPLLKQLHWLPVNYRIKFKLSTLTYRALAIHQPPYLASLLHFSNVPRQLRSSTSQQLSIPRTKLNLGKRAFSVVPVWRVSLWRAAVWRVPVWRVSL